MGEDWNSGIAFVSFGNQATAEVKHKFPKTLLSQFYDLWPERCSKRVEKIDGKVARVLVWKFAK